MRLFLALWPSPDTLDRLQRLQQAIAWPPRARPTRPDHLHVTVHFLGDVQAERVPALAETLDVPSGEVCLSFDAAEVWARGLVVLTAPGAPPALRDLHGALGRRLMEAGVVLEGVGWRSSGYALVESAGGEYRTLRR